MIPIVRHFVLGNLIFVQIIFVLATALPAHGENDTVRWSVDRKEGLAATGAHNYARAEKLLKQALNEASKFHDSDSRVLISLGDLADFYASEQKYAEARPLYMRILHITESRYGPDSPKSIGPLNNIVRVTCAGGMCYDTIPQLQRLLSIRRKAFGPNSRDVPVTLLLIGEAYEKHGNYKEAANYFRQAIASQQQISGKHSAMVRALSVNLDRVNREQLQHQAVSSPAK